MFELQVLSNIQICYTSRRNTDHYLLTLDTWFGAAKTSRGNLQVTAAKDKKGKLMWEALREAVDEEMEKDPDVCVIGTPCSH